LKNSTELEKGLSRFVPSEALPLVCSYLRTHRCHLKVTPGRKSKLGDFRPAHGKRSVHHLSVNGDMNRYGFLITLVHEIAHMTTWEKHKNKVKPHGSEWKSDFKELMDPILDLSIFPEDVNRALTRYMNNPAAASCSDLNLSRALRNYDKNKTTIHLEELPANSTFIFNEKRVFKKGEKLRRRYQCIEVSSNKKYLFHPLAEVKPMES
jgi:hypothetical protein